jgi:hypothetical protein
MDHYENPKEFEELSEAISRVIADSEEVMRIVQKLHKENKISPESFLVLVFKMESLDTHEEEEDEKDKKRIPLTRLSLNYSHCVDGKKLTPNEIAFQEYSVRTFKEKKWLKKLGLILDNDNKNDGK